MTKEEKAEREAKARELFAQGKSVNEVAKQVFKNYWKAAKAVKDAIDGKNVAKGAGDAHPKKKKSKRQQQRATADAVEPPEDWDLTLQLLTKDLDQVFGTFTAAEKATAIQAVMQDRLLSMAVA